MDLPEDDALPEEDIDPLELMPRPPAVPPAVEPHEIFFPRSHAGSADIPGYDNPAEGTGNLEDSIVWL